MFKGIEGKDIKKFMLREKKKMENFLEIWGNLRFDRRERLCNIGEVRIVNKRFENE